MHTDYSAVSRAYDSVGSDLDAVVRQNPINAWMREVSRVEVLRVIRPRATLLEIGCGTGADAIYFASLGHRVIALDISAKMVEISRAKVRAAGLDERVIVLRGRLKDVVSELARSVDWPFDGAYANFSLTYERSIGDVAHDLYTLMRHRSPFLFTLPNKLCLLEPLLFLATLRPWLLTDRLHVPRLGRIRGEWIPTRAYTPSHVRALMRGTFRIRGVVGVPVFLPPPRFYDPRIQWLAKAGETFDRELAGSLPWNLLGDTTLFWTERE